MKRMLAVLLAVALIVCGVVSTTAATEYVAAMETEYRNVLFSNGYRGFCVDYGLTEAEVDDQFILNGTQVTTNNQSGAEIANYLKAIFVEGFHNFFVKNSNGVYEITTDTWDIPQRACWHFSDNYENYWEQISPTIEAAKAAVDGGLVIPDEGYTKMVDETTEVTFSFATMQTTKEGQQCFFAYAIAQRTVEQEPDPVDPPVNPDDNQGEDENEGTNNPPAPPAQEETPTDVPVVTPTEPVVTPTDPDDDTNDDSQMGDDDQGKNPPVDPDPEDPTDDDKEQPEDESEDQPKNEGAIQPDHITVTPGDLPKTGENSLLGGALATLGLAAAAFVMLKKRK